MILPWENKVTRHDEILAGIYHKGQEKIWDGRDTLRSLVNHHGGVIDLDQHVFILSESTVHCVCVDNVRFINR